MAPAVRLASIFLWLLAASGIDGALMESLPEVPTGWRMVGRPAPTQRLRFRIAMAKPNEQNGLFEQTLYNIADPHHENYGKHLTKAELKRMLKPREDATTEVLAWLFEAGIDSEDIEDDGEWINFYASVQRAEDMLDTQFDVYHSDVLGDRIRTLEYSLPDKLQRHIDMVQPTTRFGQGRPQWSQVLDTKRLGRASGVKDASNDVAASCDSAITPACLKDLYNINGYTPTNASDVGFAAFNNFLDEYPRFSDLETFEAEYATYAVGENFTWTSVDGGLLTQDSSDDSTEANLDVQYLLSIGYPVPIHAYTTPGNGPLVPDLDQPDTSDNEPYLEFFTYILGLEDEELPHTLTTSYGEDEQSVPLAYRQNVCSMIGQLGARGVSVLFSSGDTGVGSACQTNDGANTTAFLPIFPAACPYVTSVGGTYQTDPEVAISFSSGGFSNTWARPSYQDAAVSAYLDTLGDTWDGLYNASGRGFPDVAAQSYHFYVVDQGDEGLVSGTSAASPTFAGVVALLNAARIEAGLSPLGFLNPWIYSIGYQGLTDIVDGGNTGCTGTDTYSGLPAPYVPYASWNATSGWDPVTGYGTPDFQALLALINITDASSDR
ncbi:hypothetical protein B0A50_02373 [Salinomyces thailandicus]|uniref:tripeptidyl-peptidase II n=1 Tax=Salinomyces thailandicus TaxID=706561 RepID=A0A4U0U655_9PEZI|nr:hypothetical protein B0A50_02373 [Salinomyces thailandica]